MAAGQLKIESVEVALMLTGGAILGMLELLSSDPCGDAGKIADSYTEMVLRAFEMEADAAAELCSRPLPPISPLG